MNQIKQPLSKMSQLLNKIPYERDAEKQNKLKQQFLTELAQLNEQVAIRFMKTGPTES